MEMQLATALNLIQCKSDGTLSHFQELQIPWAEAILETSDDINIPNLDERRRERLKNKLNRHKLKVDFICIRKDINDKREDIVNDLSRLSDADKIVRMFGLLEELRNEISDERGYAIGFMDGSVPADSLQKIYLNFKSFLKEGFDPVDKVSDIYEFSVGHGEIESDDSSFLVIMLKWLELETLVDEINKKINALLNSAEKRGATTTATATSTTTTYKEEPPEDNTYKEEEEAVWEEEGEGDNIVWVEQYDEKSGYFFYFNTESGESIWEKPTCAYLPFSLSELGYELVEGETAANGDDNDANNYEGNGEVNTDTDWVWNDAEGRWDYQGTEEEASSPVKEAPATTPTIKTLKTADYNEDAEEVILKLDVNSNPSSPVSSKEKKKGSKKVSDDEERSDG